MSKTIEELGEKTLKSKSIMKTILIERLRHPILAIKVDNLSARIVWNKAMLEDAFEEKDVRNIIKYSSRLDSLIRDFNELAGVFTDLKLIRIGENVYVTIK